MNRSISSVLLASLLLALASTACSKIVKKDASAQQSAFSVKVRTAPPVQHHFRKQIRVQGTIQAYILADVAARVAGNMDLKVDDGDPIKKGQVLFEIDQDNLKNRVAQAKQALKVIEETRLTMQLDVDIAKTQLDKAQLNYNRAKQLQSVNALSTSAYEDAEVALDKAQKTYEKAEAALRYTDAKVDQARLDLAICTKDLDDATEKAPYDGVVAVKYHENGEFIGRGVSVIRINDPRRLRAACLISAVYFDAVKPGVTPITVSLGGKSIEAKVDWCSPVVDSLSRTFTMRSYLPDGAPVVDGMLVDVDITLAERDGLGIPRDAVILKKGGKSAVFAVQDGRAQEIEVETGITSDGFTEILNPDAVAGRNLIVSGQYFVNDGSEVNVTNAN